MIQTNDPGQWNARKERAKKLASWIRIITMGVAAAALLSLWERHGKPLPDKNIQADIQKHTEPASDRHNRLYNIKSQRFDSVKRIIDSLTPFENPLLDSCLKYAIWHDDKLYHHYTRKFNRISDKVHANCHALDSILHDTLIYNLP